MPFDLSNLKVFHTNKNTPSVHMKPPFLYNFKSIISTSNFTITAITSKTVGQNQDATDKKMEKKFKAINLVGTATCEAPPKKSSFGDSIFILLIFSEIRF